MKTQFHKGMGKSHRIEESGVVLPCENSKLSDVQQQNRLKGTANQPFF